MAELSEQFWRQGEDNSVQSRSNCALPYRLIWIAAEVIHTEAFHCGFSFAALQNGLAAGGKITSADGS
jgi:hypothetical protein